MKTRKMITVFLAMVLAMTMGVMSVYAADGEPAEVQDTYEFDGITYVNVGDKDFSTNQTAYYKAMLGNKLTNNNVDEDMRQYSISDLWMQMAWYMAYYNNSSEHAKDLFKRWNRLYEPRQYSEHPDYWEPRQQAIMNLLLAPDTGEIVYDRFPFKWGDDEFSALWFRDTLHSAANSTAMAEEVARTAASMEKEWGEDARVTTVDIKNAPDESGLVFYRTLGTVNTDEDYYKDYDLWSDDYGHATHMVVVTFSDFTVTPIIPAGNNTEPYVYIESTNDNTDSSVDRTMVSDVKNASTQPTTVSQSISESNSQTLTSNISGSSSHAVSDTHKTGIKIQPHWGQNTSTFNLGIELMYEYNHTVTDTVTKGWSKGESVTNTNSKTNSVSVTLPPYTAILLNQKRSSGETTYRYNCPVALNFKARIYYVSEDVRGSTYSCVHFRKIAEFGGEETGMVDLYDRYEKYKIASTADEDFIRWNDMSEHCADAINAASTTATFDSTDATFTNLTEVVKTEVDSILPILPIKYIRPVNVNDDSTLTNQQWDFDIDMNEGDSDFISRIKLKAINDVGVEFATFNQAKGHFIVVDENGNEDTSGSIVELVKVNGQNKYVAKGEGTAYLKYIINEDEYQTADMAALSPDQYITNEDIENTGSTAVIQINVHHKHRLTRHAPKAPSCTEDGNITYWTCSEGDYPCGKYFSDKNGENEIFEDEIPVKKTGHSWGEWEVTVEPTETTEGEETRECLNGCGEKLTKTLPVLTHTHKLTRHVPKAPTCTEDGNITYWTCTEGEHPCGKYFSDKNGEDEISEDETVNPATGHSWGEWEVTVQPTETTEGEATRECLNGCGETKTKVVPVLAHTHKLTRHAPKAPTCTEDGNIAYWTCSEGDNPCGKYFSDKNGEDEIFLDEMVNPATGHDWGEWKVVKEPTETVAGEKQRVCRNDPSHIEKEVIPAKGFAPGSDPNQKGVDGTAAGPGASVESADRAITGMTDDQDPKGSVYNRLQFRSNKQTTNAIILKWTKPANATQFVLYGNMCGSQNRMMKIATYIGNSKKLTEVAGKKTKKGKYYKFILVALDQNNNVVSTSKVIHVATKGGKVTNPKAVTVKKGKKAVSKVTVKMGKTVIVKSTVTKDSGKLMTHRKVEYESDNTKIATVTSNGRIKGIEKGTCYIYAYAQNGVCKKIKVTVK